MKVENDRILSLLGLSLRGNHLVVGEEPVEAAARAKDARVLLLAADAADNTRRRAERFADAGNCMWIRVPYTKEQLGQATGRSAAAIVALTDIGLAAALVRRLAEQDPERYAESARRLDLKAQRAAERRAELLAHEKNLRQGKRRAKTPEPPPAAAKAPPAAEKPASRPQRPGGKPPAGRSGPQSERPGAKPYAGKSGPQSERPGAKPYAGKPGPRSERPGGKPYAGKSDSRSERPGGKPYAGKPDSRSERPGGKPYAGKPGTGTAAGGTKRPASRPSKENRPKPRSGASPYLHSRPVKKGKGSFRKKEG